MNVVLLESLAVSHELLNTLFAPLKAQGHTLTCYERATDEAGIRSFVKRRMRTCS